MRWRWLETVAWCALYAVIGAFLLLWNTASPTHEAVYMTRTAADWLPGATRAYFPGTTVAGNEKSPYFSGNWWRPEGMFRWGRGTRNTIVIEPVADIAAGSRLVARFGIFPRRGHWTQTVGILVNGQAVARIEGTDPAQTVDVALASQLPAGVPITIDFVIDESKSALSQGYSTDQRELGVRFYELTVLPPPARNASDNR